MLFKRELLFSKKMSISFNIIGIRKYVIKKRLYIKSVTQFHELVISNDCNTKTKAPEARD